jgi:hypothetical protein
MYLDPPLPEQISNEAIRKGRLTRGGVMTEVCRVPTGAENWLTSPFQDKQK